MRKLEQEWFSDFPEVTQQVTKLILSMFGDPSGLRLGQSLSHMTWAPPIRCTHGRIQFRSGTGGRRATQNPSFYQKDSGGVWPWGCQSLRSGVQYSTCLVKSMVSMPRSIASVGRGVFEDVISLPGLLATFILHSLAVMEILWTI